MKTLLISICLLIFSGAMNAQKISAVQFVLENTNAAMPFSKFGSLFGGVYHPGAELALTKNFSQHKKSEWASVLHLGYFYHRFVQHGIPLYATIQYSHKIKSRFWFSTALGGGSLFSIPATAQFKLDASGNYRRLHTIRFQGTGSFYLGAEYRLPQANSAVLIGYQQVLQFPFVKKYVPLLPYNCLQIGFRKSILHHTKK